MSQLGELIFFSMCTVRCYNSIDGMDTLAYIAFCSLLYSCCFCFWFRIDEYNSIVRERWKAQIQAGAATFGWLFFHG